MPFAIVAKHTGGPEVLDRKELALEKLSAGTVRLRHNAIGVNFVDTYFRSGLYPWPQEKDLILGCEAAGVIEAVGESVSGFQIGDRVAYTVPNGAYATHRVIDARHLVHIPNGISDEVAAASFLKGLTVQYLLNDSFSVGPEHTVLFHAAAGGVGLIAGQWFASKGVDVIGTAGSSAKCELARQHGFAHVINYNTENFVDRVADITEGRGVDVVYDSVGNDTYPGSLKCLKLFGTLVNFGQSSGPALDFRLSDLAVGSYSVTRPILFHFTQDPKWLQSAAAELFDKIAKGDIAIAINQVFPLEAAAEAHGLIEARKTTGSTILTV